MDLRGVRIMLWVLVLLLVIPIVSAINPIPFSSEYDKGYIAGAVGNQTECDQHIAYISAYQQTYGLPDLLSPYTEGTDYYLACYSVGYVKGYDTASRASAFATARDSVRNDVSGVGV